MDKHFTIKKYKDMATTARVGVSFEDGDLRFNDHSYSDHPAPTGIPATGCDADLWVPAEYLDELYHELGMELFEDLGIFHRWVLDSGVCTYDMFPYELCSEARDVAIMLMLKRFRPSYSEFRNWLASKGIPHRTYVSFDFDYE